MVGEAFKLRTTKRGDGVGGSRPPSQRRDEGGLAGCVYLELRGERAYLGLLSVDPARQKADVSAISVQLNPTMPQAPLRLTSWRRQFGFMLTVRTR